jgi:hypothetical protein
LRLWQLPAQGLERFLKKLFFFFDEFSVFFGQ